MSLKLVPGEIFPVRKVTLIGLSSSSVLNRASRRKMFRDDTSRQALVCFISHMASISELLQNNHLTI